MKLSLQLTCFLLLSVAILVLLFMFRGESTQPVFGLDLNKLQNAAWKFKAKPVIKNSISLERISIFDFSVNSSNPSKCYPLKVDPPAKICVYEDAKDIWVSKSLRLHGSFEPAIEAVFKQALRNDLKLDVIDIGANLGLYSLIAAAMGRKAISVEPLQSNINHFHKSVKVNRFEDKISLLTNAVSYKQEKVYFKLNPTNQGGTRMLPKNLSCTENDCPFAWSIYMDDILPIAQNRNIRSAIMKMDIEGAEHFALANASKLFAFIRIPYIFMEFVFQRAFCGFKKADNLNKELSNRMFLFLKQQGYTRVYTSNLKGRLIDPETCSSRWPNEVIWVHRSAPFPP